MVPFYKLAQASRDAYFRCIEFYDQERDRVLVFLTNDLELAAATIAAVHNERWQIEYLNNAARCESGRQSGNRGQPKRSSDVGGDANESNLLSLEACRKTSIE